MADKAEPTFFVPPNFFKLKSSSKANSNSWLYTCQLCPGNKVDISTNSKSRNNLRKHLSRKHFAAIEEFDKHCTEKDRRIRCCSKAEESDPDCQVTAASTSSMLKQPGLPEWLGKKKLTQSQLDTAIINYLANAVLPFSHVEGEAFRAFVDTLSPGVRSMVKTRKPYKTKATSLMAEVKASLIKDMKIAKRVCVTADHWTSYRRGYIGVTAHWFNTKHSRTHACLALRRVKGSVTHDVIGDVLQTIFEEYGIASKITHCVTDSGSNFIKAFRVYAETESEEVDVENEECEIEINASPISITSILADAADSDDSTTIQLPSHLKCAAHRFNLIGAKDAESALVNPVCKRVYRSVMGKLQKVWNKQNMSALAADKIKESLGCLFVIPNDTRWNSRYDATQKVVSILENHSAEMSALFAHLQLRAITDEEAQFLKEFVKVMQPLALGLDVIQGQNFASAGYLIPTIRFMLDEWNQMTDLRFTNGLVGKLKTQRNTL